MNPNYFRIAMPVLFLPFKLKANTTPCRPRPSCTPLFLPFKLKANTTPPKIKDLRNGCFCLSN